MPQEHGRVASTTNFRGRTLYFDPDEMRGKRMAATAGRYDDPAHELWKVALNLRAWDAVVDVGSNYGEMIVGAEIPEEATIIAFEPNEAITPYLEKTLAAFGRPVELVRAAVSDAVVHGAQFARDVTWSGKSSLVVERARDIADDEIVFDSVEVTTLDHELGDRFSSACIKVDVEGKEDAVLRGASEALSHLEHWAVMLEIRHMPLERVAELVTTNYVYVLDRRSNELIRIATTNPTVLSELLSSWWIASHDALLMSESIEQPAATAPDARQTEVERLNAAIDDLTLSTNRAMTFRDDFIHEIFHSRSWRAVDPMRRALALGRRVFRRS